MFADLPQDLLKSVIIDWLDTNGLAVSALDVTFGHHVRGDWLHLLRSLRLVNPPLKQALPTFFSWVHDRGVQLDAVSVNLELAEELDGEAPSFIFPSLTTVAITNSRGVSNPFSLIRLISLAPSLLVLDFRGYVLTDAQLLHCAHSGCCPLLKELKLSSSNISAAAVVAVVTHFCDTLQMLYCVVLDDASVKSLARCCKKMKKIVWSVFHIANPVCLVEFCAANIDLECVEFCDCDPMTNEIVEQISLHCPKLKVLKLSCDEDDEIGANFISHTIIPAVVANCKDLRELYLAGIFLEFETDDSGTKCCKLTGRFESKSEELHALLSLLTFPVCYLGDGYNLCWADRRCLRLLVERNNKYLKKVFLDCEENSDINQEDILHLCSSCPHLVALALWVSSTSAIVDEDILRNISKRCPQLQELDLISPALTDTAVLAGLAGFRDGVLASLGFAACKITDVVVDKVEELFPHLQEFLLRNTNVSKDRLVKYIHKHQFGSLRSMTLPSADDNNWMRMQLHALGLPMTVSLTEFDGESYE